MIKIATTLLVFLGLLVSAGCMAGGKNDIDGAAPSTSNNGDAIGGAAN